MALTSGKRLGPYEIVDLLGAGGMGEVYRARDTRLDRTVALKVLPQRVTNTTQARDRFEREARAISALNHPNICTLFDVGSADGNEYLVMELIEGESLADRTAKGALSIDEVLRIGAAIADALAKAHRIGIIHRDLKPGNIMLTKSGPKLLDFGLARKTVEDTPLIGHDAPTAIANKPITTDGMVLGTLPYMAPEQLEGKPADARTDIFALGAVLYEMVTGRRAFMAESQASLITKIMSVQPPPISESQPIAPVTLNRVVMKCLAKDPEDRWQSAADVAAELRWVADGTEVTATKARRPWMSAIPWTLAALAVLVALYALRKPAVLSKTVRFEVPPAANTRFEMYPTFHNMAISPDGRFIAFLAREGDRRIFILNLATGVAKPLEGTEQAATPFWSPNGKQIGFAAKGKLQTISVEDNRVQSICDVRPDVTTATWLADGTIVFSQFFTGSINAVPSGGGTPRKLLGTPKGSFEVISPSAIGTTKNFFFNTIERNKSALWVASLDGGEPRKILDEVGRAVYDAPYVTYVRDGTLFAQRFNERSLALEGSAVPLADNAWFYKPLGESEHAAAGDTIAYSTATAIRSLRWIDRAGQDLGEALPPGRYRNRVRVSRDGRYAALAIDDPKTLIGDIWVADLQRRTLNRMTYGDHDYDEPVWSPDGKSLAFSSDPDAAPYVFMMPAGGGTPTPVTKPGDMQLPAEWLPDGRIFFGDESPRTGDDILITTPGAAKPEIWLQTPAMEGDPRVSPDGKWVAYVSRDADRAEVYVTSTDHRAARVGVSTNGGLRPVWSADGKEIYFQHQKELWAAKVKIQGDSIDTDPPEKFFTSPTNIESFDVAPDGRILVDLPQTTPQTSPMRVIVGWKEEVARLLAK